MSDAVVEALRQVDDQPGGPENLDRDSGPVSVPGEEPDARPEGPLPDEQADGETDPRSAVLSWAKRVPEGSHLDFDAKDWWDPETGGKNRIAYHLSDWTEEGVGYPNLVGTFVGLAELYFTALREQSGDGGEVEEGELYE